MDAKGIKRGMELARAAAGGDELPEGVAPVQLPLLPSSAGAEEIAELRQARGRPQGAINRATRDWADYLLSRYSSPLIGLFETFSRPTADLARELGCTRLEAYEIQRKAMADALPFVHKRMPIDVNNTGGPMVVINLNEAPQEMQEIQGLAEIIEPPSESDVSESAGQGVDPQAKSPKGNDNEQ